MAECTPVLGGILVGVLCVLTLVLLACLARAIRGPRYTDRLIALNMICTVVILLLSVLSYLLGASYLVDVIILYGLLNLLAVAVLSGLHPAAPGEKGGGAMTIRTILGVVLICLGVVVVLIAALGLFRFKETLTSPRRSSADTMACSWCWRG